MKTLNIYFEIFYRRFDARILCSGAAGQKMVTWGSCIL